MGNITLDVANIFKTLSIDDVMPYMKYEYEERGQHPNPKRKVRKHIFRNSITAIIRVGERYVNVKIPPSGSFQCTGCKEYDHAVHAIAEFVRRVVHDCPQHMTVVGGGNVRLFLKTHMTNFKIVMDSQIKRGELSRLVNEKTQWVSLLETSIGCSGVNIKLQYGVPFKELAIRLPRLIMDAGTGQLLSYDMIPYREFYEEASPALRRKEELWFDRKIMSIFAFFSGSVTVSGVHEDLMIPICNQFFDFFEQWRPELCVGCVVKNEDADDADSW